MRRAAARAWRARRPSWARCCGACVGACETSPFSISFAQPGQATMRRRRLWQRFGRNRAVYRPRRAAAMPLAHLRWEHFRVARDRSCARDQTSRSGRRRSRGAAVSGPYAARVCPYLPELHTPDEDLGFSAIACLLNARCALTLAGAIDGFIAFRTGWVDRHYVHPERQQSGIGQVAARTCHEERIRRCGLGVPAQRRRHLASIARSAFARSSAPTAGAR